MLLPRPLPSQGHDHQPYIICLIATADYRKLRYYAGKDPWAFVDMNLKLSFVVAAWQQLTDLGCGPLTQPSLLELFKVRQRIASEVAAAQLQRADADERRDNR